MDRQTRDFLLSSAVAVGITTAAVIAILVVDAIQRSN